MGEGNLPKVPGRLETCIATREGNFSATAKGKMFLSRQTYEGFKISVHSHIEAIQFLLSEGFDYVLSERFM